MSITWQETRESPRIAKDGMDRQYVGYGSSSPSDAYYSLAAFAPVLDGWFVRRKIEVQPHEESTEIWDGKVSYTPSQNQNNSLLPPSFRFSTAGGKSKMLCSYSVVGAYGFGANVNDYGGLIGFKKDGTVEGVEVDMPGFSWQETWQFTPSQLTWYYAKTIRNLSACVNTAVFRGFDPGEVLFLYAEGGSQQNPDDHRDVTFHFASNPNMTGLSVGSITGIAKGGWEYLDIEYNTTEVGSGTEKRKVQKPSRAYVHRVFRQANLSLLGIGG